MNPPHTFEIDLEYTRSLARDLDVAAAFTQPQPAVMPTDSTLADFVGTLNQALAYLTSRSKQFHADGSTVDRSGFSVAAAVWAHDSCAISTFDGFKVG